MSKYFVIRNFRCTCSSVQILKGYMQGRRQWGGQWCPAPHLKFVPPHFTFGPLVAAYIQYSILKMCPPTSGFWSPPAAKSWWRAWVHAYLLKFWRGTCSSVGMLKGYMVRERLGTPVAEGSWNMVFAAVDAALRFQTSDTACLYCSECHSHWMQNT